MKHSFRMWMIYSLILESGTIYLHIVQTLHFLAMWGYKVLKPKTELVKQDAYYLSLVLTPGKWGLSPDRVQAITQLPEPSTWKQPRAFLGLTRYTEFGYLIMTSLHSLFMIASMGRIIQTLNNGNKINKILLINLRPYYIRWKPRF